MAFHPTILKVLLPLLLACSCTVATFNKPLHKENRLHRFPKNLRGTWRSAAVSAAFPVSGLTVTKDSLFVEFTASGSSPAGIGLKNDSLQVSGRKEHYLVNLASQYGWLIYSIELKKKDELVISSFSDRTIQIVKHYEVKEHTNGMTVIYLDPSNEEWDQALQYGLDPVASFKRLE